MTDKIGKITFDLSHYPGEDLYCDGAVEDELLEIVKKYAEIEYAGIIEEKADWPILYHLSPLRENIVDWIPMEKNAKVLEVGSGCGAITGALSRKAGELTCVDLSKKRSMINAYRHAECENVTIHVGNFKDIEPDLPCDYDYIFLIGVFEYGQAYMGSDRPYHDFLNIIKKHIKENGRIIIAIENKLGLKYFAGCKEDHLGTYFSGIENYPAGGGVRTFSRNGLKKIFTECDVKNYHFYYPYPDYKFMTAVYSDEYLPKAGELSDNLRNFDRDRMELFEERAAFDGLVADGLFPVFSNSFLVVIGEDFPTKYAKFSNDRAPEYRIRTDILKDENKEWEVRKYPLGEEAKGHILGMGEAYKSLTERYRGGKVTFNECRIVDTEDEVYASFEFIKGTPLSEKMDACVEKQDEQGFLALLSEYMERIGYHEEVPVTDYDLIFSNILVDGEEWSIIDYEWTFGQSIPVKEQAFRAVYCYLLEDENRNRLNMDAAFDLLNITEEEAEAYREKEADFQKFVTGKAKSMAEMRELIGNRVYKPLKMLDKMQEEGNVNRVQIYEDRGNGFSEEESYFVKDAYISDEEVEIDITLDGNVQILRIDPSMTSCVVKVEELLFNNEEVPVKDKKIYYTNGKVLKPSSTAVFATTDPNLYIKVSDLNRKAENTLHAKLRVVKLPAEIAEDMAMSVKKLY